MFGFGEGGSVHVATLQAVPTPSKGGAIGRSLGQLDPFLRATKRRFQLQSFATLYAETFAWELCLEPSGMCPLQAGGWPGAYKPPTLGAPSRRTQRTSLRPLHQQQTLSAPPLAFQLGPFSTVPFCLLDPWSPKLASNRSEAPLAFRMKSVDFLNSSGHSCIRSGPCAFPVHRVKFVFEGWGARGVRKRLFSARAHSLTPKFGWNSFLKCSSFFGFPEPRTNCEGREINSWTTTGCGAFSLNWRATKPRCAQWLWTFP